MRRLLSIVRATALEVLSEPLVLLVTLASLVLAILAPALHYHQFGEPSRMARDAGLSAILLGGTVIAVFAAAKCVRREIETMTAHVVLAHSVSRGGFLLAKYAGVVLAYALFVLTLSLAALTVVNGAEIGGALAAESGDIARIWKPSLACALAVPLLPLATAAALNRFARFRFALTANVLSAVVACFAVTWRLDVALALRHLPVFLLAASPALVFAAAAAAFAVRFRLAPASALTASAFALFAPALGHYCLSAALARGGSADPAYCLFAFLALVPAVAAALCLGIGLINGRDLA